MRGRPDPDNSCDRRHRTKHGTKLRTTHGRTHRALAVVLTGSAIGLVAAVPAVADSGPPPAAVRDGAPQREVDAVVAAGAVGALAEVTTPEGSTVVRAGVADLATGAPVPLDAEFRIGSATKTFVATVVLQLVDEGRLSLDDTLERWLPGVVAGNGNDGAAITVRQLLGHTSGISDYTEDLPGLADSADFDAHRFRTYAPEELVAWAMRHPPRFAPGTDWSYSNTNYLLAGMIVERVTGHSWEDEVNTRIVAPLGLRHTGTPGAFPFLSGPHALGYTAFGDGPLVDATDFNPTAAGAAGSMTSTTGDLGRFYQALVGGEVLSPARLADMQATVPAPELGPDIRYGLGLGWVRLSCGDGYFGHPGDVPGYHTWDAVTPDAERAVVLSYTGGDDESAAQAVIALVDAELCGTPAAPPVP